MREKNQIYTAEITGYTSEGLGVALLDGQVGFVHGGVRGERCTVPILRVQTQVAFAKVRAVLASAPGRQAADCPHYPSCGGCAFRHVTYQEELEAKRQRVEDALRRVGGADIAVSEILPSPQTLRYRNKGQFPVGPGGEIGFYRARSHQVIPVSDCLLQHPAANRIAGALREYMRTFRVPGYDERTGEGLVRHLYVRTSVAGEALVCVVVNGERLPHEEELAEGIRRAWPDTAGVVLNTNKRNTNVILGEQYRTLWGTDRLEDTLCGLHFSLSIPSFYQVNRDQAERLYAKAMALAGLTGRETVLDLYCGTGTITLAMAGRARRVIGAEIVAPAIEDARRNAAANGITNAEFFCGDAGEVAARLAVEDLRPDVITVDPPRKGLGEDVVAAIARMAPERVVYVSCDPATLGRDVKRFVAAGYRLREAAAVDMFPRTAHVETAALLERPEGESPGQTPPAGAGGAGKKRCPVL